MKSTHLTRRRLLRNTLATSAAASLSPRLLAQAPAPPRSIAPGPFEPTWPSLRAYKTPDWFRDAKFGIWAHWSAQCVPEQGDWYARQMYLQGHPQYEHHRKTYGHPSTSGFMEIDNLWKADQWQPEELMGLYQAAGAKYFVSLANHHDNFDNFASTHHAWNSTRIGPKKDIVGAWAAIARAHGLRFGVSNHSAHAWHWLQTAYDYDPTGPQEGVRYDAFNLTKADGKGKWWDGLDPQELYTGRNLVMPSGLTTVAAANDWHEHHDRVWTEEPPPNNPEFVNTWFLRCQELMDKYQPDLIYFDNDDLPPRGGRSRRHRPLLQRLHRPQRLAPVRRQRQEPQARPHRRHYPRHRTRPRQRHPRRALADRHLHRRLALQTLHLRQPHLQDAAHRHPHPHRRGQQKRQPTPLHPRPRQRRHRRG